MSSNWYLMNSSRSYSSGYENQEYSHLNAAFLEVLEVSPESFLVKINQVDQQVIIQTTDEKNDDERTMLSVISSVKKGDMVSYQNKNWMVTSLIDDNKIHQSSNIKLCNSKFPLPGEQVCTTKVNDFGEEYEECVDSAPQEIPCIVETSFYKQGEDQPINLTSDTVRISIPYTEHDSLKVNYSFKLYGESYQVSSFDYTQSLNKIGLLIINAKRV